VSFAFLIGSFRLGVEIEARKELVLEGAGMLAFVDHDPDAAS
jgi:hypothetical protein